MAAKAALASIIMVLAIWLLGTFDIVNFFVILPIAMLVYFASATLLRTIPREDIRALSSALWQKVHVPTQSLVNQQEFSTSEIELAPGDMPDLSDAYAQTEPRLEVPWWLRSPAAFNEGGQMASTPAGMLGTTPNEQEPQQDENNDEERLYRPKPQ